MSTVEENMKSWEAYAAEKERLANLKNVVGGKVYMPQYGQCEYNCLEELILELRYNRGYKPWRSLFLDHIVQYNIRYRDSLRAGGIDNVIDMLIEECPSLISEEKEFSELRRWWKERMSEHIADYDIQCYPVNTQLSFCGFSFDGIGEIESQVELSASDKYRWDDDRVYPCKNYTPNTHRLHVGELWESYPTFDSYDASDGRSYDNFIIRAYPITVADLRQLSEIKREMNACRVHEDIPENLLLIVYHDGDNEYMLVATNRYLNINVK